MAFFASQSKFVAFFSYAKTFNNDSFDYDALAKTDYVYMRWKEHFLVPDHTIKDINGASFAGFYYICFQKSTSRVEGYYFHRNSEWYVGSYFSENLICNAIRCLQVSEPKLDPCA